MLSVFVWNFFWWHNRNAFRNTCGLTILINFLSYVFVYINMLSVFPIFLYGICFWWHNWIAFRNTYCGLTIILINFLSYVFVYIKERCVCQGEFFISTSRSIALMLIAIVCYNIYIYICIYTPHTSTETSTSRMTTLPRLMFGPCPCRHIIWLRMTKPWTQQLFLNEKPTIS